MMIYAIVKFVWFFFWSSAYYLCVIARRVFRRGDVSANRYRARGTLSPPSIRTPGVRGLVTSWIFKWQFYCKMEHFRCKIKSPMSWGIQYWIIIKKIKKNILFIWEDKAQTRVLDLRTYTYHINIRLEAIGYQCNQLRCLWLFWFVCLFVIQRGKMVCSTWWKLHMPEIRNFFTLDRTIIFKIKIYSWTRSVSAMTLNCAFSDYPCNVLYLLLPLGIPGTTFIRKNVFCCV